MVSYGQNGYVYGLMTGPITHATYLALENITEEQLCKKIIVFQVIDVLGNFSITLGAFNLPNTNVFSETIEKLMKIVDLWNINEKFPLIGSVADGEFLPEEVEYQMRGYNWI